MKVWLSGTPHHNAGGLYRVYQGLLKYLPEFGVEIVSDPNEADVLNPHIGMFIELPDRPMVISSHGMLWRDDAWGTHANKANRECLKAYRRADVITAPSKFVAKSIARYTGADVRVIHHGIDSDIWVPGESKGYVLWNKGRVDAANKPEEMNNLADLAPDTMFYSTFGEEADNVYIFGKVEPADMQDLVKSAGVYLDTPRESGGPCFGVLEAMSCGVPTLSWNFGGTAEAIEHKKTGYLAEYGNYQDLLDGLYYCLNNKDELGKNALEVVKQNYQWEQILPQYISAYEEALSTSKGVSIIIPSYNLGNFLPECLDSVLEQEYTNWEAIVIDDASTDDTASIIQRYEEKDTRIKGIYKSHNEHVSAARNDGVAYSTKRYVIPLDADDRLLSTSLKDLCEVLDSDADIDIVAGKLHVYREGKFAGESGWPDNADLDLQLQGHNRLPYASMYRRKVFDRVGGYRRRIRCGVEDADFFTRALSFGYKAEVINIPTLRYTERDDSLGKVNDKGSPIWLSWFPWNAATSPAISTNVRHFNNPDVSIIIPVGPGHSQYIQACIDSVIAQTHSNWEIILVNDTGELWGTNNKYLSGTGFVTIIDTPINSGVAFARNLGVSHALADKIIFLDVDDTAQAQMVEVLLAAQEDVGGWVYGDWYMSDGAELKHSEADDWDINTILSRSLAPITGIYEKAHVELVIGFDTSLAGWEDWDFHLKLVEQGICGTRVKYPLISYNMHLGFRREENFASRENLLKYIKERYRKKDKVMGCKSCGGARTVTITQNNAKNNPSALTGVVLMEYVGGESQTVTYNSPTRKGTRYRVNNRKPFTVFGTDVDYFLSKRTGRNEPLFKLVETPKPVQVREDALPLVSEQVPVQKSVTKVTELELDTKITKKLIKVGYDTIDKVSSATDADILSIVGIGASRLVLIREAMSKWNTSQLSV